MFKTFLNAHELSEFTFRDDFLPSVSDRAFWDAFEDGDLIPDAEKDADYAWPIITATDFMEFKKSGNRTVMQTPHFDRRVHLVLFALAELKENQGRFLPQIVNGLQAICEETFWGLSAHLPYQQHRTTNLPTVDEDYIDLYVAETAEHLCVITRLLREPLQSFCPEILDRVAYEIERRVKTPYLRHRDWGWIGYHSTPNNWNPWILSNLLTVFLLTEKCERVLCRALKKMLLEIQFYYDAIPEDGGCDEGANYWGHAGGSLFEFLYQLKQATNGALDLFGDAKLGRIASYMKKAHTVRDLYVNVADCHATGKVGTMPLVFGFAEQTKQRDLMSFAARIYCEKGESAPRPTYRSRTMRRLIYETELIARLLAFEGDATIHEAVEYLPNLQLAVLREGEWTLAAKGGHNAESHNHNDVGSYTLYEGDTAVLVDVGINTYTRFTFQNSTRYSVIPWTQSTYHCLPVVNGAAEHYGRAYAADSFAVARGKAEVSFANAYPEESGLQELKRTLTLTADGVCCQDSFTFLPTASQDVCEILMSILPTRIEAGTAILGDRYRVFAEKGCFEAEWVAFEDSTLENDWKTDGVWRLKLNLQNEKDVRIYVERL